jgi:DNA mismatch repair protein MutS
MIFLRIPEVQAVVARPTTVDPDEMVMDAQTYRDLEIFEAASGPSLYDLCNSTRTLGGAKVLAARMRKPLNKAERIRAVQESLAFVRARRPVFDRLPSTLVTHEVQTYLTGSLPLVSAEHGVPFYLEAMNLRFGDFRPYAKIYRGVQLGSKLIHSIQQFVAHPDLRATDAKGDIAPLLTELETLIARPAFRTITARDEAGAGALRVIRVDRLFRAHERATLERMLDLVYEIDALVAMADTCERYGWVVPEVEAGPLRIEGEGVSHPFVSSAIANPVHLGQSQHVLFLTGPNMAGKTTYLRSCGIALYLAHVGMAVPAKSFCFSPCERLFSSINISDDVRSGVSFFRAEALRVKAIVQAVTDGLRVVAMMDEPFKGTNVMDALDASRAVLEGFIDRPESLFMVSSHLIELGEGMRGSGRVDLRRFEANEEDGRLRFDYVLRPGISTQRLGMRVLREEGIFSMLERGRAAERPAAS